MLNYKNNSLWFTFILCYCIGGLLVYLGLPFRLFYVTFIPLLVILLDIIRNQKIKFDYVIIIFIFYMILIFISGLLNNSPINNILKYFRHVSTPLIIYYFVLLVINSNNISKVIKYSILLGMCQLPIVVMQKINYEKLSSLSPTHGTPLSSSKLDFDFGTFYWKDDPAMTMFLLFIISFLLFDKRNNGIVKNKNIVVIWLSTTILIANSMIGHLILFALFFLYVFKKNNLMKIIQILFSIVTLSMIIYLSGYHSVWTTNIKKSIEQLTFKDSFDTEKFLTGNYARSAAVIYYLSEPIKIIGDGPSSSYDPISRTYKLGNTGLILLTYSELGIFGIFIIIILFYSFSYNKKRVSKNMSFPIFFILIIYCITSSVLTDASMIFASLIFSSTDLMNSKLI